MDPTTAVIDNRPYQTQFPDPDYFSMPDNIEAVSVSAAPDHTVVLQPNAASWGWGDTRSGSCIVNGPNWTGFIALATALYHSVLVKNDGSVVIATQLAVRDVPSNLKPITAVAAGNCQSIGLQFDGTVAAWGSGVEPNDAITNLPAGLTNVTAIASGDTHAVALKSDGTIVLWGSQTYAPPGATNIVAIAAGGRTTIAKRNDNHIFVWGNGNVAFETDQVVYAMAAADDFVVLAQKDFPRDPINLTATPQNSSVKLSANLNGGYHYQLQSTQDFLNWQSVGAVFGAGTVNSPLNQPLDNATNTFYRLVETQ